MQVSACSVVVNENEFIGGKKQQSEQISAVMESRVNPEYYEDFSVPSI